MVYTNNTVKPQVVWYTNVDIIRSVSYVLKINVETPVPRIWPLSINNFNAFKYRVLHEWKEGFWMKPSIAKPWHHLSIHHFWRDLLYRVPSCRGASALPATNGAFVKLTDVIVIWWNLNGVILQFSHKWGEIAKQILVGFKVTGVIEILKDNRCFWDFPLSNYTRCILIH